MGSDLGYAGAHAARVISIHAPAWGATDSRAITGCFAEVFQSTLPHGERLASDSSPEVIRYFNPRSRMGSDQGMAWTHPNRPISIHAPAWGATKRGSAYAGGAGYFNPRSRMGSDYSARYRWPNPRISIHAPAWGATGCGTLGCGTLRKFQSTLPHGERLG